MKKTTLKISLVLLTILAFLLTLIMFSNVKATDTDINAINTDTDSVENPIDEEETLDIEEEDLFEIANESYTMDRLINGNAFIMGSDDVTITGQINGSLYVMAKNVTISSEANIVDAVYILGTNVKLDAPVYDCYVCASNFEMGENGFVQRDLRVYANDSTLLGTVYRNAFISSSNINYLNDDVGLLVYGNLEYNSKEKIENEEAIAPYGEVKYIQDTNTEEEVTDSIGHYGMSLIQKIVFTVIIYVLIAYVTPKFNTKLADYVSSTSKSVKAFFIGLLSLIVIPIISIILFITIIGLPVGLILLTLYILLAYLSTSITEIAISNKVAEKINLNKNIWTKILSLVIVIAVIYVLKLIPVISSIVGIITVLLGFGIVTSYLFGKTKEKENVETSEASEISK